MNFKVGDVVRMKPEAELIKLYGEEWRTLYPVFIQEMEFLFLRESLIINNIGTFITVAVAKRSWSVRHDWIELVGRSLPKNYQGERIKTNT